MAKTPHQPTNVDIDRRESITITWDDGQVSHYRLDDLRLSCQCAECRGLRERDDVVWPRPGSPERAEVVAAEPVGAWGLSIVWNDGHTTGIYTWDMLRAWSS